GQPAWLPSGQHAHLGLPHRMRVLTYALSIAHSFDRKLVRNSSTAGVRHFYATSNRCLRSGAGSATVTREPSDQFRRLSRWITAREAGGHGKIPPASGSAASPQSRPQANQQTITN